MSHSESTADTYYRAYGQAKSLQGFQAVGDILKIPDGSPKKKRQRFSEGQTEAVSSHFAANIKEKLMPSSKEIDGFLESNADGFKGRVRGDIYSKVRNLIGRK